MTLSAQYPQLITPRQTGDEEATYSFNFDYQNDGQILVQVGASEDLQTWVSIVQGADYVLSRVVGGGRVRILNQASLDGIFPDESVRWIIISRVRPYAQEVPFGQAYDRASVDQLATNKTMEIQQLGARIGYIEHIPGIADPHGTVVAPNERNRLVKIWNDEAKNKFKGANITDNGLVVTIGSNALVQGDLGAQNGTFNQRVTAHDVTVTNDTTTSTLHAVTGFFTGRIESRSTDRSLIDLLGCEDIVTDTITVNTSASIKDLTCETIEASVSIESPLYTGVTANFTNLDVENAKAVDLLITRAITCNSSSFSVLKNLSGGLWTPTELRATTLLANTATFANATVTLKLQCNGPFKWGGWDLELDIPNPSAIHYLGITDVTSSGFKITSKILPFIPTINVNAGAIPIGDGFGNLINSGVTKITDYIDFDDLLINCKRGLRIGDTGTLTVSDKVLTFELFGSVDGKILALKDGPTNIDATVIAIDPPTGGGGGGNVNVSSRTIAMGGSATDSVVDSAITQDVGGKVLIPTLDINTDLIIDTNATLTLDGTPFYVDIYDLKANQILATKVDGTSGLWTLTNVDMPTGGGGGGTINVSPDTISMGGGTGVLVDSAISQTANTIDVTGNRTLNIASINTTNNVNTANLSITDTLTAGGSDFTFNFNNPTSNQVLSLQDDGAGGLQITSSNVTGGGSVSANTLAMGDGAGVLINSAISQTAATIDVAGTRTLNTSSIKPGISLILNDKSLLTNRFTPQDGQFLALDADTNPDTFFLTTKNAPVPNINVTADVLPKGDGTGGLVDSAISETATTVDIAGTRTLNSRSFRATNVVNTVNLAMTGTLTAGGATLGFNFTSPTDGQVLGIGDNGAGGLNIISRNDSVAPGTIGSPAVYSSPNEISSSDNMLVPRPSINNVTKVLTALANGVIGWSDTTQNIDRVTVNKIIQDSQEVGDILNTYSRDRLYSTANRLYDSITGREILKCDGSTVSLKQYLGFILKADLNMDYGELPNPIQLRSTSFTGFRKCYFFRTKLNNKYILEIQAVDSNSTSATVFLHIFNMNNNSLTLIRSHNFTNIQYIGICGNYFVVDDENNFYSFTLYKSSSPYYFFAIYNLATGIEGSSDSTNKWLINRQPIFLMKNNYLYVFYGSNTSFFMDKINPKNGIINYIINGKAITSINSQFTFFSSIEIDSNNILITSNFFNSSAQANYAYGLVFNFVSETSTSDFTYLNSLAHASLPIFGHRGWLNSDKSQYMQPFISGATNGTSCICVNLSNNSIISGETKSILPGQGFGWSYGQQHEKYRNLVLLVSYNKSKAYISYEYGAADTWQEIANFNTNTNFETIASPGATSCPTYYNSDSIFLDENKSDAIFTGWQNINSSTDLPAVIQKVSQGDTATLPNILNGVGAYIVTTEYRYLPVVWFSTPFSTVIGKTLMQDNYPVANAITNSGEYKSIAWASGVTPPTVITNFATSYQSIKIWCVAENKVYIADDGYSFELIYTAPTDTILSDIAFLDDDNAIITSYNTTAKTRQVSRIDTTGNINILYNESNDTPNIFELDVGENYVVCATNTNDILYASKTDYVFSKFTTTQAYSKLTTSDDVIYGIGADGTTLYKIEGMSTTAVETVLRDFTGSVITDIDSASGILVVSGYTGANGDCYFYNATADTWIDKTSATTADRLLSISISSNNVDDYIMGGASKIYYSSDQFTTVNELTVTAGASNKPANVTSIDITTTGLFTVFYGIGTAGRAFVYHGGDINSTIVSDLIEINDGNIAGITASGAYVWYDLANDQWTRKLLALVPDDVYTYNQPLAYSSISKKVYVQDDSGHIGVSDNGLDFNVAAGSPIGASNRGGGFIAGLAGNVSILALDNGRLIYSDDDWNTAGGFSIFNADEFVTYFSRDYSRNDIVYACVCQKRTGSNICKIVKLEAATDFKTPTTLFTVTLTNGFYLNRINSYNNRIVAGATGNTTAGGSIYVSIDYGSTWTTITGSGGTIKSLLIDNSTDTVYLTREPNNTAGSGLFYNTFNDISGDWIQEDLPISSSQNVGAHLINKLRTMGVYGNIGVGLYYKKYNPL